MRVLISSVTEFQQIGKYPEKNIEATLRTTDDNTDRLV